MALIAHEDFDSPLGNIADTTLVTQTGGGFSTSYGENGSNGWQPSDNEHHIDIACNATTVILGARIRWVAGQDGLYDYPFRFYDENAATICQVGVNSVGEVMVKDANGTLVATSVGADATEGTFFTIEIKITMGASSTCVVRVNRTTVLNLSGEDFLASGTAIVQARIRGEGTGITSTDYHLTWLYLCDTTGSYNTDFLGDVTAEYVLPDGNGNQSDWVGSDGNSTDNYQLVDEDPYSDADYVQGSTEGDIDLYSYADTSGGEFIIAVQPMPRAWLPDGGSRFLRPVARVSATDYTPLSSKAVPATGNGMGTFFMEANPNTSSPWSAAAFNGAEFGIEVRDT